MHMGQNNNKVAPKTTKRRTFGKKSCEGPGCKSEIKNPCTIGHVRLKVERTSKGFDRRSFGLEFVKKATGKFGETRRCIGFLRSDKTWIGPFGGVDLLQNGRRDCKWRRNR